MMNPTLEDRLATDIKEFHGLAEMFQSKAAEYTERANSLQKELNDLLAAKEVEDWVNG
jgi:hypothetical protein